MPADEEGAQYPALGTKLRLLANPEVPSVVFFMGNTQIIQIGHIFVQVKSLL